MSRHPVSLSTSLVFITAITHLSAQSPAPAQRTLFGGLSPTTWNLRPEIALEQTGLINGLVIHHGGDTARRIIAPGDAAHSQILTRMTATQGFLRMPLVGTRETDTQAVELLGQWIESLAR